MKYPNRTRRAWGLLSLISSLGLLEVFNIDSFYSTAIFIQDLFVFRLRFMNINYIGSKKSLLDKIEWVLKQNLKLEPHLVFGDLFSGTGVVGEHLNQKFGMQIISNDCEYYSFVINYAKFKCVYSEKLKHIIQRWNKWSHRISKYGLFSQNYAFHHISTKKPNRKFFLLENAQKIDGFRILIERYYQKHKINQSEYFFLLAS